MSQLCRRISSIWEEMNTIRWKFVTYSGKMKRDTGLAANHPCRLNDGQRKIPELARGSDDALRARRAGTVCAYAGTVCAYAGTVCAYGCAGAIPQQRTWGECRDGRGWNDVPPALVRAATGAAKVCG